MHDDLKGFTGTRWRHLKRGTSYEVVGVAKLQTALTEGLADEAPMVVYRNEATGKLSVRSLDEFCDGRFEKLNPAAPAHSWQLLMDEICFRFNDARAKAERSEALAPNSYGAGFDRGYSDALGELLEYIAEGRTNG